MNSNDNFSSKQLLMFMIAIDNYDLYHIKKLIRYGTNVCIAYMHLDFDLSIAYYKKFNKLILHLELEGTSDLVDPIREVFESATIKFYL